MKEGRKEGRKERPRFFSVLLVFFTDLVVIVMNEIKHIDSRLIKEINEGRERKQNLSFSLSLKIIITVYF